MALLGDYRRQLREISVQAPTIPLPLLLWRLVRWKILRGMNGYGTVPVHVSSRMRLHARSGDHGIRTSIFLFREAYEPSVRFAIDSFVGPGSVCYDIGANQGLWSLRMAERAGPHGQVFAFEPIPDNISSLQANAALSGCVIGICAFALGDREGRVDMHLPHDVGSGSLAAHGDDTEVTSVEMRRLDDVWRSHGCPDVSLVKLDVEGAELLVLKGASAFLAQVMPVVCCEINPERLAAMGAKPIELAEIFIRLSYRTFAWDEQKNTLVEWEIDFSRDSNIDVVFLPPAIAAAQRDGT